MRLGRQQLAYVGFHEASAFLSTKQIPTNQSRIPTINQLNTKTTLQNIFPQTQNFLATKSYNPKTNEPTFNPNFRNNFDYNFNLSFGRGRGQGRNFFKPRIIYQLCGKPGHVALQCYHRFDTSFQGGQNHDNYAMNDTGILPQNNQLGAQAYFVASNFNFQGNPNFETWHSPTYGGNPQVFFPSQQNGNIQTRSSVWNPSLYQNTIGQNQQLIQSDSTQALNVAPQQFKQFSNFGQFSA